MVKKITVLPQQVVAPEVLVVVELEELKILLLLLTVL